MFYNKLLPYILTIIIIIINTLIWSKINIPYLNPEDVRGNYSINNYSVHNDTLRFLLYVFVPLIFFFTYNFIIKYKEIFAYKNFLKIKKIYKDDYNGYLKIFLFLFISVFISYLSIDLPIHKLDIFHDGQLLTGAINYFEKGTFWDGSYLNTGLFYDQISTILAFKLFNIESVGSYRIFQIILQFFTAILIIIFCFSLSKHIQIKRSLKNFFILLFIIFSLFFLKENHFYYRHIPIFLFLIFLNEITFNNSKKINYILISLISSFAFFWSIDVGAYVFVTFLIFLLILIINNKFLELGLILFSFLIFWIVVYLFFGQIDFNSFISNTLGQYKYNELYNGIIHPDPFSGEKNSTRATKALIIFIINGLILINLFFKKDKIVSNEFYLFLILFYIISIFNYKTGLSRSDGGHIAIGSSFCFLLFIFLTLIRSFYFLEKKNILIKNILLKISIIITVISLTILSLFNEKNSLKNFVSLKSNFIEAINKNNNFYLNKKYIELVEELKNLTVNLDCFQAFNYEPTIYFLINKKSCTKYYQIQSIGSKSDQENFILEMEKFKPKYLLVGGEYEDWGIKPSLRFPIIFNYVTAKYQFHEKIYNHKILILIE